MGLDNVGAVTAKDLATHFGSIEGLSKSDSGTVGYAGRYRRYCRGGNSTVFNEPQNLEILARLKEIGIDPKYENKLAQGVLSAKSRFDGQFG